MPSSPSTNPDSIASPKGPVQQRHGRNNRPAEYVMAPEVPVQKPEESPALGKTPGFESAKLGKLFETIDKLRECGVSEDISLPQLVVVGDQSSGKSSVLDALTGIPFPVASTLCTRFATQISFRRAAYPSVKITITPAASTEESRAEKLRAFSRTVTGLTAQSFCDILSKASEAMGLPKPEEATSESSGPRFADDILKIELCGPDRLHFSVVDVPGLFQSATKLQSAEDIVVVESMVKRYLRDERTIILAVASSVNETANQKIFGMAKQADPKGLRTVGLLTKPDIVPAGEESRVMDVALNRVTPLVHGWFVVRNRSTEEVSRGNVTAEQRRRTEQAFFKTNPWSMLDKTRVGIESLERYLRTMLYSHMRNEYPNLLKEIDSMVRSVRTELEKLGPARETAEQQRIFLIEIATKFHDIARDAVMGYSREVKIDGVDDERNLRTTVRLLNEKFAKTVKMEGHTYDLQSGNRAAIYDWISQIYKLSRGAELEGLFNPQLIPSLFREQTREWERISKAHILTVNIKVTEYVMRLLKMQCPDSELCSKLGFYLKRHLDQSFKRASDELQSILESERTEVLMTHDDAFVESVNKQRKQRMVDVFGKALPPSSGMVIPGRASVDPTTTRLEVLANLESAIPSDTEQTVTEIFDYLKSYYGVARTRFIDCVCLQVIERHFVGSRGSVQTFSPTLVGRMKEDELQRIAGQDPSMVERRQALSEKLKRLENASALAQCLDV